MLSSEDFYLKHSHKKSHIFEAVYLKVLLKYKKKFPFHQ